MHYYWLPMTMLAIPITLGFTFYLSIAFGHIQDYPPYISNTGTTKPEKGWFSQLCNIYAVLLSIGFYIRYLQVKTLNKKYLKIERMNKLNIWGLYFGYLMCLGLSILACFQVSVLDAVHFIGAVTFFFMGHLYFVIQLVLSYYMTGYTIRIKTFLARLVLTVGLTITATLLLVFKIVSEKLEIHPPFPSYSLRNSTYGTTKPYVFFRESEKYHCISAVFEWIVTILLTILALTNADEFSEIKIFHPETHFTNL